MDRGSAIGAAGTLVIPAPRCCTRLLAVTRRRVGRLRPARAEPIGVLDSLVEMLGADAGADPDEDDDGARRPARRGGVPQTLQ